MDEADLTRSYYRPKAGGRKKKVVLFSFLFLVFVAFVVFHAIGLSRVISGITLAQDSMTRAQESATVFDFPKASDELENAKAGLARARTGAKFFVWTKPIPWLGDQVEAVTVILDAGEQAVVALQSAVDIAGRVYQVVSDAQEILNETNVSGEDLTFNTLPPDIKSDLLHTLHQSLPDLQEAQVQLRLIDEDLDQLHALNVAPQILEAIEPFEAMLPDLIASVDFLIPFAATVEDVAGVDADRQWLVLFMNDMELRPGGGFLGVYGLVTMRDGEIKSRDVADTYAVDVLVQGDDTYFVPPPEPLARYVGVSKWYFRDANWSPDFPTAARDSVQLLRQEVGHAGQPVPEIHGVFGLTPTFASSLLTLTGPIEVDGETFTSANLAQKLEFEVEYGFVDEGIAVEERKQIVEDLVDVLMDRLFELPIDSYPSLFSIIKTGFGQKQVAVYSAFEDTQKAFVDYGWSGQMNLAGTDDVLMVVDANLAALKSDPAVERTIHYRVISDVDGYLATVSVDYDHQGTFDEFTTRYRTYTRVYAPLGSQLVSYSGTLLDDKLRNPSLTPGEVTVANDLGMTSFGAFTSIEPGTKGTLSFTYRLPESVAAAIDSGVYELRAIKQMGSRNHSLTLDLDFGKSVRAAQPPEASSNYGDDAYSLETVLDGNKDFLIELR